MRYNTFLGMVYPFINARGNSIMFPPESLQATVNLSIQQIYNEYKWKFLFTDENLADLQDLTEYFVAEPDFPVKYILGLQYTDNGGNVIELFPEHSVTEVNKTNYSSDVGHIYIKEDHEYTLTYIKDFIFQNFIADTSTEIPLPDKFIPALYYLVLSQLDLVDVQQSQGQPANNFNKYQYEIKNLKDNDMSYEGQIIGVTKTQCS